MFISSNFHRKQVCESLLTHLFVFFVAMYLMSISILAGFWGQYFIRKLVTILGRASIIVFILSGVIFVSALTMGEKDNIFALEHSWFELKTYFDTCIYIN